ncbi:glycosyltransferase [Rhodopila sp.]|uniref:glycosyltransferase n=1 Tax=Rhodopila sp. TaxID=2480087 RepID=UPI003D0D1AE3
MLVWQWGRRGAGPRFAACLAEALRDRPGLAVTLSLCRDAEIMTGADPPRCEMPVSTYRDMGSLLLRLATAPFALPFLLARLWPIRPDLAICAMPGPLDLLMAAALRLLGARLVVVVHEAEAHPGDGFPMQMALQRALCRRVDGLAALSSHVAAQLRRQRLVSRRRRLIRLAHPPFAFTLPATPAGRPAGPPRLLFFGRLLPYKGLDLLAEAIAALPPETAIAVRVVGHGPACPALAALAACRGVTVENRWVPESEIGSLLEWSNAVILPYREASQSGVAAAAMAAGRPIIATRVGGLREQLSGAGQAVLCDPDPASLARGIMLWLETPTQCLAREDAGEAWRQAAAALMLGIRAALPARPAAGRMMRKLPALRLRGGRHRAP